MAEPSGGLVRGKELESGVEQGAWKKNDALGARSGHRDVESVETVDKLSFLKRCFLVAHAVAHDDTLGLLALHFVHSVDEGWGSPVSFFGKLS